MMLVKWTLIPATQQFWVIILQKVCCFTFHCSSLRNEDGRQIWRQSFISMAAAVRASVFTLTASRCRLIRSSTRAPRRETWEKVKTGVTYSLPVLLYVVQLFSLQRVQTCPKKLQYSQILFVWTDRSHSSLLRDACVLGSTYAWFIYYLLVIINHINLLKKP